MKIKTDWNTLFSSSYVWGVYGPLTKSCILSNLTETKF